MTRFATAAALAAMLSTCAVAPALAEGEPIALNGYCRSPEGADAAFKAAYDGDEEAIGALDMGGQCNFLGAMIGARLGRCADVRLHGKQNQAYQVCEVFLGRSKVPLYWFGVLPGRGA